MITKDEIYAVLDLKSRGAWCNGDQVMSHVVYREDFNDVVEKIFELMSQHSDIQPQLQKTHVTSSAVADSSTKDDAPTCKCCGSKRLIKLHQLTDGWIYGCDDCPYWSVISSLSISRIVNF